MATHEGWHVLDENAGVLYREYTFSKGAYATTLVFRGSDGLVVLSPASRMEPRELDALRDFGDVRALVATNTFHHLGQSSWRAHFPEAVSYCPPGAVKGLMGKMPGVEFQSLGSLALPEHVRWEDPPGFKSGETILSVTAGKRSIWYTGDLLTNIERTPGPPVSWLFSWLDVAPGFRLFKPGVWLFVNNRRLLRAWMLERLLADPPSVVVPGHGPPVDTADVATIAREQIERL